MYGYRENTEGSEQINERIMKVTKWKKINEQTI